uniref:Uncharacterized protein n=1 Tax=Triticum urartu TaxID=4572 RepID=A0A8R7R7S5_TRIUA
MIEYHVQVWGQNSKQQIKDTRRRYWTDAWSMNSSFSGATLLVCPQAEETFLSVHGGCESDDRGACCSCSTAPGIVPPDRSKHDAMS